MMLSVAWRSWMEHPHFGYCGLRIVEEAPVILAISRRSIVHLAGRCNLRLAVMFA